ncbi:Transcription termination protein NusB [Caenispirillum salinarum AK4]|uniref:Transcription antitermination protein NusB n=1 Tax=Caenispirillum salinarum AK4 TaxID=1238182 RepID=K9HTJ1_9PROT|nr:transcription antitermination factor NusB [Caenispirillum salinarum]EKV31591.1 Transcription termination protein NusB [Caenispirillum salinarum AK4]
MTDNQSKHAEPRAPRPRKSRLPGGGSRRRSAARLAAVQALYMIHIGEQSADDVIRDFLEGRMGGEAIEVDPDTEEERVAALIDFDQELFVSLVRGVLAEEARIDETVSQSLTSGWQWDRMENTVREMLRCGSYEIMERVDVPPRVAINEYVDVAHAFYAGPETRLVNAVLDRLARVVRPNEMERGRDGDR